MPKRLVLRPCAYLILCLAVALGASPAFAHGGHDPAAAEAAALVQVEEWPVHNIVTSIAFAPGFMEGLDLRVVDVRETASLAHHDLSVSAEGDFVFAAQPPLSLDLEVRDGVLHQFSRGVISHDGGFDLVWDGGALSFDGFLLRPGQEPRTLDLHAANGVPLFNATHMHFELTDDRLDVFNMDLRLTPQLAAKLGEPNMAGAAVGVLAMRANTEGPRTEEPVRGGVCDDFSGDVDVALIDIGSVGQSNRANGFVGVTPSATLKNVGTANVPWYRKFTAPAPPYNNDQHPFLVWSLYRFADGRIEQLGVSDIKHAFLTLNFNCDPGACTNSDILGLGCEDVYGTGTNNSYNHVSLREEIEAGPALWNGVGSHFDQNGDGVQDHPGNGTPGDGGMDHRLPILEADLDTLGAEYWIESWYIIRDDINIFNNMGHQQVGPSQSGSGNWSFPTTSAYLGGPAIDRWADEVEAGVQSTNETLQTAQGHVQIAVRVRELGGGLFRYEYAVMNHDIDAQFDSFTIPVPEGALLQDVLFRDNDQDPGNEWTFANAGGFASWSSPNVSSPPEVGEAQDWGMLFNFGFTTPISPEASVTRVTTAEPNGSISVQSLAPLGVTTLIFANGFESGDTTAWD
ncbi:MAG: hypothetical protein AAGN46_05230 [Acidobacteriota bacterium]